MTFESGEDYAGVPAPAPKRHSTYLAGIRIDATREITLSSGIREIDSRGGDVCIPNVSRAFAHTPVEARGSRPTTRSNCSQKTRALVFHLAKRSRGWRVARVFALIV